MPKAAVPGALSRLFQPPLERNLSPSDVCPIEEAQVEIVAEI